MGSSSLDDCYFYYYSSCTKGSDCPFRHCEAALGTETVCTLWREGICYRSNCKFRHMESRINRSSIPCYWENQPGGCRKPHCVFFHHKDRSKLNALAKTEGLILPVSSQPVSPSQTMDSSADNKRELNESHSLSPSHPIQPVVVSLGEGEESDTESATSTPIKIISSLGKKTCSPLKTACVPAANAAASEIDLGIKTLEQIRMEKIHRESEHFYNPGQTDITDSNVPDECEMLEMVHTESNGYYPQEYSTAADELMNLGEESYQNASSYPMVLEVNSIAQRYPKSPESTTDLRDILKKKRHLPDNERFVKEPPTKRIISLKKSSGASEELSEVVCTVKTQSRNEDDIGFRVKTLDEIKKEKEKRQAGKTTPFFLGAEIQDEENDVDQPITNLSHQFKGSLVENKVKPEVDKPIINLPHEVKVQYMENRLKPEGSKRKLCRKPLELYRPVHKEKKDMEESKRMLERYSIQGAEDSVSDYEDAAKNNTQEIISIKEENQSSHSLKQACDSDVPVSSKVRKTISLQRLPPQKLFASGTDEETPSRLVVAEQKSDSSLTFKRRSIIRRKNFNNLSSSHSCVTDEDTNSQLQNSDSQKDLLTQTSKLSVSSSQNGTCLDTGNIPEKIENIEMSEEKEKASKTAASSSPRVPVECQNEKGSSTPSTLDELDTLFLGTESDICIDETSGSSVPKAEDLFLEFEKIIQS